MSEYHIFKKKPSRKRKETPSYLKDRVVDKKEERSPSESPPKQLKVLVMEPEANLFELVEETIKGKCMVANSNCTVNLEDAVRLLRERADAVVIGFGFRKGLAELVKAIRIAQPEAKIIKLAGTDEYKSISSEYKKVREGGDKPASGFDLVVPYPRLSDLGETIGKACKKG